MHPVNVELANAVKELEAENETLREKIRQIKAQPDPPYVIVLSLFDNREYRVQAQRAGADCFLNKDDVGGALRPIIRCLHMQHQARQIR